MWVGRRGPTTLLWITPQVHHHIFPDDLLQQHLESWTSPILPICLRPASWKFAVSEEGGSPSYKTCLLANRLFSLSVCPSPHFYFPLPLPPREHWIYLGRANSVLWLTALLTERKVNMCYQMTQIKWQVFWNLTFTPFFFFKQVNFEALRH